MKYILFLLNLQILFILIVPICLAQSPTQSVTPNSSNTNTANTNQANNLNSNSQTNLNAQTNTANQEKPTNQEPPNLTTVKVNKDGVELSGFPTWIIWVLLGTAIVGGVGFYFYAINASPSSIVPLIIGGIILLIIVALLLSIGAWWGRSGAREDFKQIIAAQSINNQNPVLQQTTAPIQIPAPTPNTNVETGSGIQSLPFYIVVPSFLLLLLPEIALIMYVFYRWGRGDGGFEHIYRLERSNSEFYDRLHKQEAEFRHILDRQEQDVNNRLDRQEQDINNRLNRREYELSNRLDRLENAILSNASNSNQLLK